MAGRYRGWCGECEHKTEWLTESGAEDAQIEHYLARHPGIPPGGRVEFNAGETGGGSSGPGCLGIGLIVLLVIIVLICMANR